MSGRPIMQNMRQRSFQKKVMFKDVEEGKKQKAAQRIGNFVRYGNTVFELREPKEDSIYCTILEVGIRNISLKLIIVV